MVRELSYNTTARVVESWDQARRVVPDFENTVGKIALLKLFELEPRTKTVFGFTEDYNPTADELDKSGNLLHAVRMIHMFDAALSMLGPDIDTLNEVLEDLGKRHIRYQVKPHYFPYMGKAIRYALAEALGDQYTKDVEAAWVEVYDELSGAIMKSILIG